MQDHSKRGAVIFGAIAFFFGVLFGGVGMAKYGDDDDSEDFAGVASVRAAEVAPSSTTKATEFRLQMNVLLRRYIQVLYFGQASMYDKEGFVPVREGAANAALDLLSAYYSKEQMAMYSTAWLSHVAEIQRYLEVIAEGEESSVLREDVEQASSRLVDATTRLNPGVSRDVIESLFLECTNSLRDAVRASRRGDVIAALELSRKAENAIGKYGDAVVHATVRVFPEQF